MIPKCLGDGNREVGSISGMAMYKQWTHASLCCKWHAHSNDICIH